MRGIQIVFYRTLIIGPVKLYSVYKWVPGGFTISRYLKLKSRNISFAHIIFGSCPVVLKFCTENGGDRAAPWCPISKRFLQPNWVLWMNDNWRNLSLKWVLGDIVHCNTIGLCIESYPWNIIEAWSQKFVTFAAKCKMIPSGSFSMLHPDALFYLFLDNDISHQWSFPYRSSVLSIRCRLQWKPFYSTYATVHTDITNFLC